MDADLRHLISRAHSDYSLHRNENPGGASAVALRAARAAVAELNRYPDPDCDALRGALARHCGVGEENIAVGNGLDEIIFLLSVAALSDPRPAILTENTFLSYSKSLDGIGKAYRTIPLEDYHVPVRALTRSFAEGAALAFVCNPHNPTGTIFAQDGIQQLCETAQCENVLLIIDEAYAEYAESINEGFVSALAFASSMTQVCVLRTFSKAYGLAGLRIGYLVGDSAVVVKINRIREALPFSVNRVAQDAALLALQDQEFIERTGRENRIGLATMYEGLNKIGISYVPSHANFVLIELPDQAERVATELAARGIMVASAAKMGMPRHIRLSVGSSAEIDGLLGELEDVLVGVCPAGA
jgi:histidinol-phosphate aminotransferase